MVGFAQLERTEVIVVTMLQLVCERMVGSVPLQRIEVIAVTMLQVPRQRSPSRFLSCAGPALYEDLVGLAQLERVTASFHHTAGRVQGHGGLCPA